MNSTVQPGSGRRFALAAALGLLKFVPAIGLSLAASGRLGLGPYRALERIIVTLGAGLLAGQTEGLGEALLWLLLFLFASFTLPMLVSFVVLRRTRYVLTTLASSLLITALSAAYGNVVDMADMRRSFEDDERHRTSVAIDTLTYELADRMPVKPDPFYGDGFERVRLLLVLDVVEPGETRVKIKFRGQASAREIRKSRTVMLERGKQRVEFEFVAEEFPDSKSFWLVPGDNPKSLHPSWLEGWKCYAEIEVERPSPYSNPPQEVLWGRNDEHTFVLEDVQVQDVLEPSLRSRP